GRHSLEKYTGNTDFWLNLAKLKISKNNLKRTVLPDIRFINEVKFIRENSGIIIRVERSTVGVYSDHVSNNVDLPYDIKFINDKPTVEEFLQSIDPELKTIVTLLGLELITKATTEMLMN